MWASRLYVDDRDAGGDAGHSPLPVSLRIAIGSLALGKPPK
jgi:hypothetical protein